MGLLDSLLAGVAGSALRRSGGLGGVLGGGGGRKNLLIALLPVVLSMLANRRGNAAPGRGGMAGGLGGLGGLGALAGIGGLGALLQRFQQSGYGDAAQSWISTGENQPLPPEAVSQVFDNNELSEIASRAGVSEDDARAGLSQLLPQVVDHLTPQGEVPSMDQLGASVDQFMQELDQHPG